MNTILSAKVQNINGIPEFQSRNVVKLTFLSMKSGIGEIEKISKRPARGIYQYNVFFYAYGADVISQTFTNISDCMKWLKGN